MSFFLGEVAGAVLSCLGWVLFDYYLIYFAVLGPTDYLIATTKIINGKTLIESIMEEGGAHDGNPFT